MNTIFFEVQRCEGLTTSTSADGSEVKRRKVVMREIGGKFENAFLVTAFGDTANLILAPGDVVASRLKFRVNEHEGNLYQDIVASEIVKLKRA